MKIFLTILTIGVISLAMIMFSATGHAAVKKVILQIEGMT